MSYQAEVFGALMVQFALGAMIILSLSVLSTFILTYLFDKYDPFGRKEYDDILLSHRIWSEP